LLENKLFLYQFFRLKLFYIITAILALWRDAKNENITNEEQIATSMRKWQED